jgi:ribosomal protein S13
MIDYKKECIDKSVTINKLNKYISDLESIIQSKNVEIKYHIKIKQLSEDELKPVRDSLNKMTSEHGRLLRKLKRANKIS